MVFRSKANWVAWDHWKPVWAKKKMAKVERAVEMTQAFVVNRARNSHPYTDRTQNLTNSILPGKVERTFGFIEGEVAANMKYSAFVEEGTSRSRPHPYLEPALFASMSFFRRAIERAVR